MRIITLGRLSRLLGWIVAFASCALADDSSTTPTPENAKQRIVELRAEIARRDELYFRKAAPEISDLAYDELKRELHALEAAFPQFSGNASALSLGDDRTGRFPTYHHREPMLSLAKSYTKAEFLAWHERVVRRLGLSDVAYVIEPKFDGLAISVIYEDGHLVRAVTRGNGEEGDDVTTNALTIRSLPRELRAIGVDGARVPVPKRIELRGEIYLGFAEFERINREQEADGEEPFAHPRNLAAGTLKESDPTEVAKRHLDIVFYGIGACEPATVAPNSQMELHALIRAWGLPGVEHDQLVHGGDAAWKAIEAMGRQRAEFAYPTDGAVAKVDLVAQQHQLGATQEAPLWAIAFKYAPDRVTTKLRGITIQVGRTGALTPVAELDPVRIGGSMISRASLHNADEIARRDIRIGDFVVIEKAGEVIPNVTDVDRARRPPGTLPFRFPETCPICRSPVVRRSGESAVRCPNVSCPAQLRRKLEHFAAKSAVGLEGLSPRVIGLLADAMLLKSPADFYRIRGEDLEHGAGCSPKSAARILAGIEASKRRELWRFIYGLGIPRVGAANAKSLAAHFGELERFAAATRSDYFTDGHIAVSGVGEATVESVLTFFERPENRTLIRELIAAGVQPVGPAVANEDAADL
jgi:DNA ligase (NAD+)